MSDKPDDDWRVTRIRPVQNGSGGSRGEAPDFAALLQQIAAKWRSSRTGGGNGGGSRSGGGGAGPGQRMWLIAIAAIFVVIGIVSAVYTVDISEEGVVTRFGAYNRTTPSGIHFKMPFGIERVTNVQSKRILQEEFGFRTRDTTGERSTYDKQDFLQESLMLTGDLNVADVEWIMQFRISDPWKYLFHARDVQRNLRAVSLSIMRRVVGDRLVGDVLTTGRVEIADQAKLLTQEVLDVYDMGIKVEKIILQGVNPPEKVKPAFNEVNAAKQEQEQTINNAEREYNRVIPEARGKAAKVIADADAYAIDTLNRAKGDATRFTEVLKSYRQAPELTRQRLYIEALEEVFSKMERVTIVDSRLKGLLPVYGNLQGLPLPVAKGN